jgi:hypothetical protein
MINDFVKLQKNLGFKLQDNIFCLAIDTATKSGITFISIIKGKLKIETFVIKLPALPKDMESKAEKYEEHLKMFYQLILDELVTKIQKTDFKKGKKLLVLENSFLKMNIVTFGILRAYQGIAYATLKPYFNEVKIIFPITARKLVGFESRLPKGTKGKEKKAEICKWISNVVEEEITEDNCADSLLLAFAGLKK